MKSIQTLALAGLSVLGLSGCATTYVAKTITGEPITRTEEISKPEKVTYSLEQERIRGSEFQATIFEESEQTKVLQTTTTTPTEKIGLCQTISPTAEGWILGNGVYILASALAPLTFMAPNFAVPPPILADPIILCTNGADDTFYSQWCRGNFGYDFKDIGQNNPAVEKNSKTYISSEKEITRKTGDPIIEITSEKISSERTKRILPHQPVKILSTADIISPNPYITTTDQRGIVRVPFSQEAGKLEFILLDSQSEIPLKTISLDLQ